VQSCLRCEPSVRLADRTANWWSVSSPRQLGSSAGITTRLRCQAEICGPVCWCFSPLPLAIRAVAPPSPRHVLPVLIFAFPPPPPDAASSDPFARRRKSPPHWPPPRQFAIGFDCYMYWSDVQQVCSHFILHQRSQPRGMVYVQEVR
jgi:hypothetical protein